MPLEFILSVQGNPMLLSKGYIYLLSHVGKKKYRWRCRDNKTYRKCRARVHTDSRTESGNILYECEHNHPPEHEETLSEWKKLSAARATARANPRQYGRSSSKAKTKKKSHLPTTRRDNVEPARGKSETFQAKQKSRALDEDDNVDDFMEYISDDSSASDSTMIVVTAEEKNLPESSEAKQQRTNNPVVLIPRLLPSSDSVFPNFPNIEEIQDENQLRLIERREAIVKQREAIWQQRELHAKKMKIAEAQEKIAMTQIVLGQKF